VHGAVYTVVGYFWTSRGTELPVLTDGDTFSTDVTTINSLHAVRGAMAGRSVQPEYRLTAFYITSVVTDGIT